MKNQKGSVAIIIIILIVLVVGGVGVWLKMSTVNTPNASDKNIEVIDNTVPKNVEKTESDKEYIYEYNSYDLEVKYKEADREATYKTTLKCPYINLDSADARKLNLEFEQYFEKAKKSVEMNEDESGFSLSEITYEASVVGDKLISLAVSSGENDIPGDATIPTKIYNIDIQTGKLIDNQQLFDKLGITKEKLGELIEKEMRQMYETAQKQVEQDENISIEILEQYENADQLVEAAKTDYETADIYVIDENSIGIVLQYKNIESNSTWTKIQLN